MLNRDWLKRIRQLHRENKVDSLDMATVQFHLAKVLCHEIMHAIHLGMSWRSRLVERMWWIPENETIHVYEAFEPYYEDQPVSEVGLAWEWEIFGGTLGSTDAHTQRELPSGVMFCYKISECCEYPTNPRRGDPTKSWARDILGEGYFVSAHYIHAMQQQTFWEPWFGPADQAQRGLRIAADLGPSLAIPTTIRFQHKEEIRKVIPLGRATLTLPKNNPNLRLVELLARKKWQIYQQVVPHSQPPQALLCDKPC